jgi:CheY-like chemotaxis protein
MGKNEMAKLIMVVNDSTEMLDLFKALLTDEGYKVSLQSHAVHDLEAIKEVKPDLLIVDQLIGKGSLGWELIQKMKMDSSTADIPIVVCTAAINVVKEIQARLTEKNIVVVLKPFDISEFITAVKVALGEQEQVVTDSVE